MPSRRSVSLPLFALLSVCGLQAQFADIYRQAAQSYRNAAAQESGATQSCMLANASYYDCLANQLSNGNLSCTQPSCSLTSGGSPNSSGGLGTATGGAGGSIGSSGAASGTMGGSMNPMILNLMCNHCRVMGTPCPTACRAGSSFNSSPSLGGLTSGGSGTSANIQAGADLAVGLIQGIFNRRAAKQAAEEAQQEAEIQRQQDAADRQREMDELQTTMRAAEAERIQTEACNTLIEAARMTGGSVDLGGGNACAQAIQAELAPLATYSPTTGRAPIQPQGPTLQLDGTNIPRVIDFSSSGSAPGNAMDQLMNSAAPAPAPSPSSSALDQLSGVAAPAPAPSTGSSALDQLSGVAAPNSGGPLDQLAQATGASSSTRTPDPSLNGQDSAVTFGPPRSSPGSTPNVQYELKENTAIPSSIEFGKPQQEPPLLKGGAAVTYDVPNQPNDPSQVTYGHDLQTEAYQKPVAPVNPRSQSECDALFTQWTTLVKQIDSDHRVCLGKYSGDTRVEGANDVPGSLCKYQACQDLHYSLFRAPQMRSAAVSACRNSVSGN